MTKNNDHRHGVDAVAQLRSLLARTVAADLRLASKLNALVWEQGMAVLDSLAASAPPSRPQASEAPTAAVCELDAELGELLAVSFLVENQHDRTVDIAFAADPLTAVDQAPVPPDVISFDPSTTVLPPGGQLVVRAEIEITERFAVGAVYSTALSVREWPTPPVRIAITVTSKSL
jgi:hypothetical protein